MTVGEDTVLNVWQARRVLGTLRDPPSTVSYHPEILVSSFFLLFVDVQLPVETHPIFSPSPGEVESSEGIVTLMHSTTVTDKAVRGRG